MYIKCWGSRGSIPVSGVDYIQYGGDTTCMEIRARSGEIIIVDAGTGIRRLGNQLIQENRFNYHFLLTHAHWDHLMGFPFFKPLYRRESLIKMHRCPLADNYVEQIFSRVMAPPNFPVQYSNLKATMDYQKGCPQSFDIGSIHITPIPISHPNQGSGYKFVEDGRSVVFLTDNELGFVHPGGMAYSDYLEFCKGVDLLIHDAEYTPKEYETNIQWGHSSYTDVLKLAMAAGVRQLGLFHINQERTDPAVDQMVHDCRLQIKAEGAGIKCFAVACDQMIAL